MILMNLQEQLQNHVRVHATEAMMACWELEQQLYNLTGERLNYFKVSRLKMHD